MSAASARDFLSQTYIALRGPNGAPQTATETISKLADRLAQSTLITDRRVAILSLKGLARDCKQDVGQLALPALLDALVTDAPVDSDLAKALLETLLALTETDSARELGLRHTDQLLADTQHTKVLFALLAEESFYTRFAALQLLSSLLANRRLVVQSHFLMSSDATTLTSVLEEKREIIRNGGRTVASIAQSLQPTRSPQRRPTAHHSEYRHSEDVRLCRRV